jgi:hypothetical protein
MARKKQAEVQALHRRRWPQKKVNEYLEHDLFF